MKAMLAYSLLLLMPILAYVSSESTEYFIGSGIHDITGPAANINMVNG